MADDLFSLMQETAAVKALAEELSASDRAGTTRVERDREYRLRRAVLDQRHLAYMPEDTAAVAEAQQSSIMLREFDALHGTHQGPVPATDPKWVSLDGAAQYVRQEAAAAQEGEE